MKKIFIIYLTFKIRNAVKNCLAFLANRGTSDKIQACIHNNIVEPSNETQVMKLKQV